MNSQPAVYAVTGRRGEAEPRRLILGCFKLSVSRPDETFS